MTDKAELRNILVNFRQHNEHKLKLEDVDSLVETLYPYIEKRVAEAKRIPLAVLREHINLQIHEPTIQTISLLQYIDDALEQLNKQTGDSDV